MTNRRFLLLFSVLMLLAYAGEVLVFSWDLDDGISVQHTSNWMNQWLLQREGLQNGEWIRLFTWPFIHDLNRIHFGLNLWMFLILMWFIPKISFKKLGWGLLGSWGLASVLFLLMAPKSHYLLGSSHWIFFLWGLALGNEKTSFRSILGGLGILFAVGSFFTSGWISGTIHASSFALGILLLEKPKKKSEEFFASKVGFPPARLQLIQQKIQQSGFESLLNEEKQIWKEAHGQLD